MIEGLGAKRPHVGAVGEVEEGGEEGGSGLVVAEDFVGSRVGGGGGKEMRREKGRILKRKNK